MERRPDLDISPNVYRTGYLKFRSVLYDRATSLPAFPVLFDRLRTLLDDRRCLGVLHLEIGNLHQVESLYGWQVFDRIVSAAVDTWRGAEGRILPRETLFALNHVAGGQIVAFIGARTDGSEVDGPYLNGICAKLTSMLERAFQKEEFAGLSPKLTFRVGHALLSHNPFYRFERRVYAAVEQAGSLDARRSEGRERSRSDELQRIIQESGVATLFQPVVDLRSREVHGFEALSRGPKGGPFELPRAMFAASGQAGCDTDLDRVCRDAALRACVGMVAKGKIFVNLLASSVGVGGCAGKELVLLLADLDLEPKDVVLEFSERGAGDDPETFVESLLKLQHAGFGIALDDIGTGYGSQAILDPLHPDYLKLDISLVRGIHRNLIKQELLHSLVRIAERIGAKVVAEGVETEEEAATLVAAGAKFGQGYLFAVPAPPERVPDGGRPGH